MKFILVDLFFSYKNPSFNNTLICTNKYKQMDFQYLPIRIVEQSIQNYQWECLIKKNRFRKIHLQDKITGQNYIGYGYRIQGSLDKARIALQKQMNKYTNLTCQGLTSLEKAIATNLKKKKFIIMLRKERNFPSLDMIIGIAERKKDLDVLEIAKNLSKILAALQQKKITHKNLSLQTIFYFQRNLIIDLPLFSVPQNQAPQLHSQKTHCDQQNKNKEQLKTILNDDIKSFMTILLRLTLDKPKTKIVMQLQEEGEKIVEQISEQRIKQLIQQLIKIQKGEINIEQQVDFKLICYFLEHGRMKIPNSIEQNQEVDVLDLPLFPFLQKQLEYNLNQCRKQKPIFNKQYNLPTYRLNVIAYKLCIFFQIHSTVIKNTSFMTAIGEKNIHYPFNYYFSQIRHFIKLLSKNKGKFQLTEQGTLAFYVPQNEKKYLLSKNRLKSTQRKIKQNQFPLNNIGYVYSDCGSIGRGFLLNDSTVVTSANCLYDRKKKRRRENVRFVLSSSSICVVQYTYPSEYQKCSEKDAWKYNYGMLRLGKSISLSSRRIIVHYNFSEEKISQAIRQASKSYQFFYSIEGQICRKEEIEVIQSKITGINSQEENGSPIFVQINKKMAIVGLKTEKTVGLLFEQSHYWQFYRFMNLIHIEKSSLISTQLSSSDFLNLTQEQQLLNHYEEVDDFWKKNGFNSPKVREEISRYNSKGRYMQIFYLLWKEALHPLVFSAIKKEYIQILLKLCDIFENSLESKRQYLLLQEARAFQSRQKYVQSYQLLLKAISIDGAKYSSNPLVLSEIFFLLGKNCQLLFKNRQANQYYLKAVSLAEKIDYFVLLGRVFHNIGLMLSIEQNFQQSKLTFQKSLSFKEKYSSEEDILSTLLYFSQQVIERNDLLKGGQLLQKLLKITKQVAFQDKQIKVKTDKIWETYCQKVTASANKSIYQQTMNKLKNKYFFLD